MLRHVVRLASAVLVTAAAGIGLPAPAHAATCGTASGVTVVVDFHQLGDVQTACDADGAGEYAAAQFTDVGHTLTFVQGQAFVCQVDGAPSTQCVRTPPATAYWSLWWSDGKSGTWTYASVGVASLKVPAGGYVALSWQKGGAQAPPRVTPASHSPSPSPSSSPTAHPTSQPPSSPPNRPSHGSTSGPGGPTSAPTSASSASGSATTSASPTAKGGGQRKDTATGTAKGTESPATPSVSRSDVPAGTAAAADAPDTSAPASGSGLPGWVAPVLVGALFVAAGTVALVRRRRTGGP